MIAIDTNILVYAHRHDSVFHAQAHELVRDQAEGANAWSIPWPCVHEFLAIVTNPRIFKVPTPVATAIAQVDAWQESPTLRLLAEDDGYWKVLANLLVSSHVRGGKVHDARIAALSMYHGVTELWSADRDFSRLSGSLVVRNPL